MKARKYERKRDKKKERQREKKTEKKRKRGSEQEKTGEGGKWGISFGAAPLESARGAVKTAVYQSSTLIANG